MTTDLSPWARRQMAMAMSEDELVTAIIEAAQWRGWRVHHIRRSDKGLQQGDPGFPDLVLARQGDILFYEAKTMRRHLTHGQSDWLHHLSEQRKPRRIEAILARPDNLDDLLRGLE